MAPQLQKPVFHHSSEGRVHMRILYSTFAGIAVPVGIRTELQMLILDMHAGMFLAPYPGDRMCVCSGLWWSPQTLLRDFPMASRCRCANSEDHAIISV